MFRRGKWCRRCWGCTTESCVVVGRSENSDYYGVHFHRMLGRFAAETGGGRNRDHRNLAGKDARIHRCQRTRWQSREDRRFYILGKLQPQGRPPSRHCIENDSSPECSPPKHLPVRHMPLCHFRRHEPARHTIRTALRQQPERPRRAVLCPSRSGVIPKRAAAASRADSAAIVKTKWGGPPGLRPTPSSAC